MAGFLRFVAFSALLLGVLELIVLPLALGPLLTSTVRDAGLRAQTIDVSVALFDPTLILGRARHVTLSASGVEVDPATIGQLEIGLDNASYLDRTFETVSGEASDVTLTVGGDSVHVTSVTVNGPAEAANAVARLSAADTEQLVRLAARRAGVAIDRVDVRADGVTVSVAGVQVCRPGGRAGRRADSRIRASAWRSCCSSRRLRRVVTDRGMDLERGPQRARHGQCRATFALSFGPALSLAVVGEVGFEPTRRSRGTGS